MTATDRKDADLALIQCQIPVSLNPAKASLPEDMKGFFMDACERHAPISRRLAALDRLASVDEKWGAWAARYRDRLLAD